MLFLNCIILFFGSFAVFVIVFVALVWFCSLEKSILATNMLISYILLKKKFREHCVMSERAISLTISKNLNILKLVLDEESLVRADID